MSESDLKHLALLMAVNCVRNTVIEYYHAQGKLSESDMMEFNKEVANKIYAFLVYWLLKPEKDRRVFMSMMGMMYPTNWDKPKLDREFTSAVKKNKKN